MKDFDAKLGTLLEWLSANTALSLVSGKITVKNTPDSGRGLYATGRIGSLEEIVNVPHLLLLNFTTALAHVSKFAGFGLSEPHYAKINVPKTLQDQITQIYLKLTLEGILALLSFQFLSAYIVLEKRRGINSFWKPFLDMLPELQELSLAPVVWTVLQSPGHEDLTKYLPRSTRKHTERVVKRFETDYSTVNAFLDLTLDKVEFLWAWMCINSRCLYMEMPQKKDSSDNFTLAPYVDFLNHLGNDECGIKIDTHGFHVLTSTAYTPGMELYFSYGPHSNEFLLCEYSFTIPQNRWNYIDVSDYITPLLRPQHVAFLKEAGYYADYTINDMGMSFRTEIALAALQESDPAQSRKLQAFVDGISDGTVYQLKSHVLLKHILTKIVGDCEKKLAIDTEDPRMKAISVLYSDTKAIAERTIEEIGG